MRAGFSGPGFGGRGFAPSAARPLRAGLLDCSPAPAAPQPRFPRFNWLCDAGLALFEKLRPRRPCRPAFTWSLPTGDAPAADPAPAAPPPGEVEIELFDVVADPAAAAAEHPPPPPVNGAPPAAANGAANGARPAAVNGAPPAAANGAANGARPAAANGTINGAPPAAADGAINGARPAAANGAPSAALHGALPIAVPGVRLGSRRGEGLRARLGRLGVHAGALRLGGVVLAFMLGAAPGWAQVTLDVSATPQQVSEGGTLTFSITFGGSTRTEEATVNWALTGTAAQGMDYRVTSGGSVAADGVSGSLTIAADSSSGEVVLALLDDIEEESAETIILTVSSISGLSPAPDISAASASAAIAFNDFQLTPQLRIDATNALRREEFETATFTVTLLNPPAQDVTVNWRVGPDQNPGTPNAEVRAPTGDVRGFYTDFRINVGTMTSYDGTLTFRHAQRERIKTITIEFSDDSEGTQSRFESAEEFYDVILSSPMPGTVSLLKSRATGSILAGGHFSSLGQNDAWDISTSIVNADQTVTSRSGNVGTTTVQEGETVEVQFTIAPSSLDPGVAAMLPGPRREVLLPVGIWMAGDIELSRTVSGAAAAISSAADIRISGDRVSGVAPGRCTISTTNRPCLRFNVHIPANVQTAFTVQIQVVADAATEAAETVLIASDERASGPTALRTTSFSDVLANFRDDPPTYFTIAASGNMPTRTLSLSGPTSAAENGGALSYMATLTGMQFAAETQVNWAIGGSGAAPASAADFTAVSGNIMWPASNSGPHTITITPTNDALNEATEEFSVSLSVEPGAAGATGTVPASATTTLTDDDPIAISISDATPTAEGNFAEFSIAMTGGQRGGALLLDWAVAGLGTTTAADFGDGAASAFPSGRLSVPAMPANPVLRIPLFMDALSDANEQFSVTLQSVAAVGGEDAEAWQGGAINITRSVATGTIGASMGGNRPPVAQGTISVPALVGGGAVRTLDVSTAFSDPDGDTLSYTAASSDTAVATASIMGSSLSITPLMAGTANITVTAEDPGGLQSLQRIALQVRAPATLSIAAEASAAGTAEGATAEFTVSITTAPPMAVTVAYSVAATPDTMDEDAAAEDFGSGGSSYPTGSVTIAANAASQSFTLTIYDDSAVEPQEFYTVTLGAITQDPSDPEPYALGSAQSAQGSIAVSDPVSVSLGDVQVEEGETAALPLTFTGTRPASSALMLAFEELPAGTAASGTDYSALTSPLALTVTSSSSHGISVTTTENTTPQASRTLVLRLTGTGNPLFVLAGADADANERSGTLTITDDDVVSVGIVRKAGESGAIAEAGGTATFTVALGGATPVEDVTVPFGVGGTGITAGDYNIAQPALGAEATGGSLTLSASQTSLEIQIRATDDSLLEAAEQLEVTLGAVSGGGGRISGMGEKAGVSITDDESGTAAIARQDGDGFAEGGAGAAGTAVFRITISGAELGAAAMVDFAVTGCGSGMAVDCTFTPAGGVLEIPPVTGMTTAFADLTLTAADDALNEAAETLRVAISAIRPFGAAVSVAEADASATASLADNDAISVSIVSGSATASEGDIVTFSIRLDDAADGSAAPVTVSYTIGGDVTAGDYIDDAGGSLTIPAGDTSAALRIEITQDAVAESMAEVLRVTLAENPAVGPGGGTVQRSSTVGEQSAEVQIAMSAASPRSFAAAVDAATMDRDNATGGVQVNEGDTVTFSVNLTGTAPTANATVAWELRGVESGDYSTGDTSPLTFTPGNWQTAQTVEVLIIADNLNEGAETLSLRLRGATGDSGIATATASVDITASNTISYAIGADQSSAETNGATITFSVTLSGASAGSAGGAVRIPVSVASSSTATAVDDYSISPSALVFAAATQDSAAVLSQDITLTIAGDSLSEAAEIVRIELGAPTTGAGGGMFSATRANAALTISDNDNLSISVEGPDAAVAEGSDAVFTLTIAGGVPSADLTLSYTLSGTGIAAADIDAHNSLSSTFTITRTAVEADPAGEVSLSLGITDDADPEAAETLTLTLDSVTAGAGGGAVSASGSDTATISASDPLSVSVARMDSGDLVEGAADDSGAAVFRVSISGGVSLAAVSVPFSVSGMGITAADYEIESPSGGTLNIGSGVAMGDITIRALSDNLNEAAETLQLTLQTPSGGGGLAPSLGTATASAVIAKSDPATLNLAVIRGGGDFSSGGIREGQAAIFRVTLSVPSAADISVNWATNRVAHWNQNRFTERHTNSNPEFTTAGGVTLNGPLNARGTVTILAGTVSRQFTLTPAVDGLPELQFGNFNELFNVAVTGETVSMGGGDVTRGTVSVQAAIQRSSATPRSVTVQLESTTDRDTSADGVQVDEGDTVTFRISLVGAVAGMPAPTANVTVNYAITGAESTDYMVTGGNMASGTLTFTPSNWQTAQTRAVMIADDALNEGAESITLRLSNASGGGSGGTALAEDSAAVEIRPSDPATLRMARTSPAMLSTEITEGSAATFRVTLSAASEGPVNFDFSAAVDMQQNTGPANNAANPDLSAPGATATMAGGIAGMGSIAAGMTTADLVITAVEDGRAEMAEQFSVNLSAPAPGANAGPVSLDAAPANRSASARIASSTAVTRNFALSGPGGVDPSNVNEGSAAQFTITRTGPSLPPGTMLEITWNAAPAVSTQDNPLNPTEAADLSAAAGSVTFSGSDSSETFSITAMGDALNEGTETFTVSISARSGAWTLGDPVTTTITDDTADEIVATVSGGGNVAEGANAAITVALSGGTPTAAVVLSYTLGADANNGTVDADAATDLTDSGNGAFTIALADLTTPPHTFNIAAVDDALNEAPEVFLVTIDAVSSAGTASARGSPRTFTITDGDDISVSIDQASGEPATVDEGQPARFTVTLAGPSSGSAAEITVPYKVETSGTGYTPTDAGNGSLRIAAGQTSGTITLQMPLSATLGAGDDDQTVTVTLTGDEPATMDNDEGPTAASGGGNVARSSVPAAQSAEVMVNFVDAARTLSVTGPATINENDDATGGASGAYTVTLTGRAFTAASTTVTWTLTHVGTADADFVAASDRSGSVTFSSSDGNNSTKNFNIRAAGDNLNEAGEAFTVQISITDPDADGGTDYGAAASTTIADDDSITATLSGGGSVAEGSNAVVTVTLSGGTPTAAVVLRYTLGADANNGTVDADTAMDITDGGGGSFTIATTDTAPHSFNIAAVADAINEAPEVFLVNAGTVSSTGTAGAAGSPQTFTITDGNDITVSIARASVTQATVDEGQSANFTVTLSGASGGSVADITVPYMVAISGTGYAPTDSGGGSLTISARQTSGTITLQMPLSATLGATSDDQTVTVTLAVDDATTPSMDEGPTAASGGGNVARSSTPADQSAQVAVNFVEAARTLSVTGPATINENDDATDGASGAYTVTLTGMAFTAASTTVTWTLTHVGTADADFVAASDRSGSVTFSSSDGDTSAKNFNIRAAGDNLNEAGEAFTVQVSITDPDADGGTDYGAAASTTISDDDPIAVGVTTTTAVSEGGNAVLNVDLGAIPSRDVTVAYTLGNTSATTDVDATPSGMGADLTDTSGGSITITAAGGVATGSITVGIGADNRNESAETFTVAITAAGISGAHGAASVASGGTQTFTIAESDPITVSIARARSTMSTVAEGQSAEFTVTLAGASAGSAAEITVPYAVTPSGSYTPTDSGSGSLRIAAGQTSGTITLQMPISATLGAGDDDQTVTVTLAGDDATTPSMDEGPTAASGGGNVARSTMSGEQSAQVVVNFRDAARTLSVTGPATINENDDATNGASGAYTVTLTGTAFTAASTTVTWTLTHGSTTDADFVAATDRSGSVTFATSDGNNSTKNFNIRAAGDDLNEAGETFTVQVSIANPNTDGGTDYGAAASTTIADDDPVTVAITRASGSGAVNEDSGALNFTVTLAGGGRASGVSTVVPFTISGTGITAGDYDITAPAPAPATTATGHSITIAHGSTTGAITVNITDDMLNEATESLSVTGAAASASGLRLTGAGAGGVEYTSSGNTVSVPITDGDPISVSIAVSGTDAAATAAGHQVEEGGEATFLVTLSKASASQVTVPYAIDTGPGNVQAADYTDSGGGRLMIAAGSTSGTIRISLAEDADTQSENLTVTLATSGYMAAGVIARSNTPGEQSATAEVITRSNERTLTLRPAVAGPYAEGNSNTMRTFYVEFGAGVAFSGNTDVTWTITPGATNPTEAGDFAATTGTVTIPGGSTAQAFFDITIVGDNLNEANENFSINLSAPDSQTDIGDAVELTINDDDAITYSISGGGNVAENGGNATFVFALSGASEGAVTIPFTLSGTAQCAAASDMTRDCTTPSPLTVTVAAGATSENLSIAIHNDTVNEAAETIIVSLGMTPTLGAEAGEVTRTTTTAMQSATATITDNDEIRVSLVIVPSSVKEGDSAVFNVTVYSTPDVITRSAPVQVTYAIAGSGTSRASSADYRDDTVGATKTASGGTLTIPANAQTMPIRLAILSDSRQEMAEGLGVTITAASSAGVVHLGGTSDPTSTPSDTHLINQEVTIPANAQFAYTVSVSVPSGVLTEPRVRTTSTDKAVFTLSVTQDSGSAAARSGTATIAYTISGSAAGTDYIAPAGYTASTMRGEVSLPEGDNSVTVTFPIAADTLNEGDETIIFTLRAITGAAAGNLGRAANAADRSATATIDENDALAVLVTRDTANFNEGATATFSVRLQPMDSTAILSTNFTMDYTLGGVEAADVRGETGSGLVAGTLGGTLEIAVGSSMGAIEIRAVADNLNEAAESLSLNIACDAPTTVGPASIATALCDRDTGMLRIPPSTISASDPITISIAAPAPDSVSEGSDAVFAVTLSGAIAGSEAAIMLPYSVADFTQANTDATNAPNTGANPDIEGGAAGGGLSGQRITIAAGTVSAMIRIPLQQDGLAEGAETFTVTLGTPVPGSGAGAVSLGASQASATIPANAAFTRFLSVTIGAQDSTARTANVAEGEAAQFNVKLEGAAPEDGMPVTVDWSASGTSETADHGCTSGTFSFTAVGTQPMSCPIRADGLNEAAETLIFTLSNPMGGGTGGVGIRGTAQASATATISASDPITYSITGPAGAFTEGAMSQGAARTLDFSVLLTGRSEGEVVIPFEVDSSTQTGGTARGGVAGDVVRDFTTPTPLSVRIAAGQLSGTIAIEVHNDRRNEAPESIVIALLPETHGSFSTGAEAGAVTRIATAAAQRATAMITDDAADALVLSIARISGTEVREGQSAVFEVSIPSGGADPVSSAALCVPYTIGGNGISVSDYTDTTPRAANAPCMGMLRIAAGASTGRITLEIRPDGTAEAAETLRVTLGTPTSAGAARVGANGMAQVVIPANAAAAHIVNISAAAAQVAEAPDANAIFNLSVVDATPRTRNITITYQIDSSSTAAAVDYTAPYTGASGMLSIAAAGTIAQISIPITNDGLNEGAETLVLRLLSATGGSNHQSAVGTATATVTLMPSDPLTAVLSRIGSGDLVEGGTGGAESAMLRVSLSGAELSADVSLPWRITGAVAGAVTAADLSLSANAGRVSGTLGGTLTIAQTANPTEITITLSAVADNLNEAAEMFTLALLDEAPPRPASERPGSAGPVMVSRTPGQASAALQLASSDPLTVGIAAPNPASLREGQIAVFTVTLSGASAGSAAAVMIPWSAQIAAQQNAAGEPNTDALPDFCFLPAASDSCSPRTGNAVLANAAGMLGPQQLVIAAGQTSAQLRIQALFDNLDEGTTDEQLTLSLQAPTAAAGGGTVALAAAANRSAAVDIVNVNALRTLAVATPAPVQESANIVFEVELEGMAPEQEFSVPWTLVPGSASGPQQSGLAREIGRNHGGAHPDDPDIGMPSVSSGAVGGPLSGTLIFPAGSLNSQSVTVPTLQDPLNEGRESLRLELGPVPETAGGGGSGGIPATQVVARRASAEIMPSDPIMASIVRESSALVDGGEAVYRVSFGCADDSASSAGGCIPIVSTTRVRVSYTWTIAGTSMQDDVTLESGATDGEIRVPMSATADVADDDIVELMVNLDDAEAVDRDGDPLPPGESPMVPRPDPAPIVTQIADWTLELTPNGGQVFEGSTLVLTATLNGGRSLDTALRVAWQVSVSGVLRAESEDFAGEDGAALMSFPSGSFEFASGAVPGSTHSFRIRVRADGDSNAADPVDQPERFQVTLMRARGNLNMAVAVDTQPAEFTIPARQSSELAQRRGARLRTLLGVLDRSSAQLATDVISARMGRSPGPPPWGSLSLAGRELLRGGAAGAREDAKDAGGAAAEGIGLALYGAAGRGGADSGLGGAAVGGAAVGGGAGIPGASGAAAFGGLGAGLSQHANRWQGSELPSLAELLNGSSFNARSEGIAPNWTGITGVVIWGAGGATQLEGAPLRGERTLSYEGDNYAGFLGMESMLGDSLMAGVALGYSGGDIEFSESAAAGDASDVAMRGNIENQRWSVHPYFGWWLTPELQTWMVLGWGTGDTTIEERENTVGAETLRRAEGGSSMWMASGGASGNVPLGPFVDLALRVSATRVHSELESTRFADITTGTAVGGTPLPKQRTRSLRLGGEAEVSSLLALGGDLRLRPFASAEVHMDRGDDVIRDATRSREIAFDLGGGVVLTWPSRGLDLRLEGASQVNDTGHEEVRFSLDMGYDRGADARGFTFALQSALAQTALQSGWPATTPHSTPVGSSLNAAGQHSLSGELAYGAALHPFGRPGLLTPYAAFSLGAQRRYATGLRFQSPRGLKIRLEGATENASTPNHQLRLNIELPF